MGQFRIVITGYAPDGCDRVATPGAKLFSRCGKFQCPDCRTLDFVLQMRQQGHKLSEAKFIHAPDTDREVVDDMMENVRTSGQF